MEIIQNNPDKEWDWHWISYNLFTKEKELFIERKYKEYLSAYRIQQWFYMVTTIPKYNACKRKLERQCEELYL